MLQGCVGLPAGFPIGQRNRTAMEETAVLLGAFTNREPHTCLFPVDGAEP